MFWCWGFEVKCHGEVGPGEVMRVKVGCGEVCNGGDGRGHKLMSW